MGKLEDTEEDPQLSRLSKKTRLSKSQFKEENYEGIAFMKFIEIVFFNSR